jgi:pyruvate formate lyase activating enzyme
MVLEIQRLSTEDGPGIRSTVFMKGCSMHCLWCHNPESIARKPQLQWIGSRCIDCRICLETCKHSGLTLIESCMQIDRSRCQGCGDCAEACPSNALEIYGKTWTARDLADELLKDRAFYEKSKGGVTFSGGEATLQSEFVAEVMRLLKTHDIHIALDTCGMTNRESLERLLPYVDLVLYDLKQMDPEKHAQLTGAPLENVLSSLAYITEYISRRGQLKQIWIRTPIIPQATDDTANVRMIGEYIHEKCADVVTRWDLLAFNNLCADKYERLGMKWNYAASPLISENKKELLFSTARKTQVHAGIVHWNGNTNKVDTIDENPFEMPFPVKTGCC